MAMKAAKNRCFTNQTESEVAANPPQKEEGVAWVEIAPLSNSCSYELLHSTFLDNKFHTPLFQHEARHISFWRPEVVRPTHQFQLTLESCPKIVSHLPLPQEVPMQHTCMPPSSSPPHAKPASTWSTRDLPSFRSSDPPEFRGVHRIERILLYI